MLAVLAVHGVALLLWGSPTPIFDEAGYLRAGEGVAEWVRCTWSSGGSCAGAVETFGRLGWHNPGHAALTGALSLLPWPADLSLRLLHVMAGLTAGLATHALILRFASPRAALVGALVVWLHPVQVFFRLTLWPVALSTAGVALLLLALQRVREAPDDAARTRQLAAICAILPLFWPPVLGGLLLIPVVLGRSTRTRARARTLTARVLAPAVSVTLISSLLATAVLGTPSILGLSGPENLALGNNPYIAPGRGSSLHDAESVARLNFEAARPCPVGQGALTVRCIAAEHHRIAKRTISADPGAALQRAGLRVVETWLPDDFVRRHLRDPRIAVRLPEEPAASLSYGLDLLTLLALLGAIVRGRRAPQVVAVGAALLLCTLPVVGAVGLTRLRQPLLPLVVLLLVLIGRAKRGRYTAPP